MEAQLNNMEAAAQRGIKVLSISLIYETQEIGAQVAFPVTR